MKKVLLCLFLGMMWFLLGACSSAPVASAPSTEPAQVPPPTETLAATLVPPTETGVATKTSTSEPLPPTETSVPAETDLPAPTSTEEMEMPILADVLSVEVSGSEDAYQFAVEIRSPDTGCEQYADWWEVVTEDGELIYRRILAHSHVTEQPFRRSGGPVAISADMVVIVRAHMFPNGYGGTAFRGSVNGGFEEIPLDADFAPELENVDPLPDGCAF